MSDLIDRQATIDSVHGKIFQEIVVEYPSYWYPEYKGKPYFSIKYTENGQEYIGYGTFKPETLSEYLKEYFIPSAQPEIIYCKDCRFARMTDNGEVKYCDVWSPDDKVYMDAKTNFCSCGVRKEEKNNG
jgi:hypothetical protein